MTDEELAAIRDEFTVYLTHGGAQGEHLVYAIPTLLDEVERQRREYETLAKGSTLVVEGARLSIKGLRNRLERAEARIEAWKAENVASVDLCRELYAVSGWSDALLSWYCDEERNDDPALNLSESAKVLGGVGFFDHKYPAYDLGYLMRMLPGHYIQKMGNGTYAARWTDYSPTQEQRELGTNHLSGYSRTSPENALCRLAIELFNHGVLSASHHK